MANTKSKSKTSTEGMEKKQNYRRRGRKKDSKNGSNDKYTTANNGSGTISSDNDAAWYNRYPELAKDAAQIPFINPLGKYYDLGGNNTINNATTSAWSIPGVFTVKWVPTIGQSLDVNSPVNIISREVYSFVRHANSGHSNYDAPDMFMYILAMDSMYSFYSAMVRAYGLMMMYNGLNRYMPKALVEALGFDFDNLSENMAQFRWTINQFAYKLSALYVPTGMSYFERHIWLNSGVYTDSSSVKAQMYTFKQDAYYVYEASDATDYVATLKYTPVPDKLTVDTAAAFMNRMLDPVLADEDMNIISGDMLRAFGASNLFTVSPITPDYIVIPAYSEEVLSQIQNLTVVGRPVTTITYNTPGMGADIVQRVKTSTFTPGIYQDMRFCFGPYGDDNKWRLDKFSTLGFDKMVTMKDDVPTSDDILVATRLTNMPATSGVEKLQPYADALNSNYLVDSYWQLSTEVVVDLDVTSIKSDNSFYRHSMVQHIAINADAEIALWYITQMSAFDWHPTMYLYQDDTTNTKVKFGGQLLEVNNFTIVNRADLEKLHETSVISEFYIPDVRKLSSSPMK